MSDAFADLPGRFAGIEQLYRAELGPALAEQESERRGLQRSVLWKVVPLTALGIAVALYPFVTGYAGDPALFVWIGLLAAFLAVGWGAARLQRLRKEAHRALLGKLCGHLGLSYEAGAAGFAFGRFQEAGLLPSHHRRHLEDHITGSHAEQPFELVEAHLEERRTSRDSKGRTRTYYVTVFRGLLIHTEMPKRFAGRTLVTTDGGLLGNLLGGLFSRGERVALESPDFERIYEVYASDQVEARVLLTPTMMERLTALASLIGRTPKLAFLDGRLWLAVPRDGDQFAAGGIFSDLTDEKHLAEILQELGLVFRIFDTLDLKAGAGA